MRMDVEVLHREEYWFSHLRARLRGMYDVGVVQARACGSATSIATNSGSSARFRRKRLITVIA